MLSHMRLNFPFGFCAGVHEIVSILCLVACGQSTANVLILLLPGKGRKWLLGTSKTGV